MNDGRERLFRTLPNEPVSVKKEMDGDEEAATGVAFVTLPLPDRQHRDRTSSAPASSRADNSPLVHLREQEEALSALVAFRSKEVERLRQRLEYYKTQVEEAERKLKDSQSKLAGIRSQPDASSSSSVRTLKEEKGAAKPAAVNETVTVKEEKIEPHDSEQLRPHPCVASTRERQQPQQPESRPPLIIPAVRPKPVPPSSTDAKMMGRSARPELTTATAPAGCSGMKASPSRSSQPGETFNSLKRSASSMPIPDGCKEIKNFRMKTVQKEHQDLVSCVRRSMSPCLIRFKPGVHISSQHKRKLRCLEINPVNDQLFITSALDGVVNLWQLQGRGSGASLLSTTDCLSLKQRRWPEDIAWHPDGNSLFAVYTADGGDAQISILNLNSASQRVFLLQEKPHIRGIINSIQFLPSADLCFVTGGSDHAVILWSEGDNVNEWKPRAVHRNLHSSAVMGVAGLHQRNVVLSVGVDKRIIGFDLLANRADFKHQTETKCLSVLPNPCDFNLFMVQLGTPEKQLRLFDIRSRQTEIHSFGWKQESSESQSALINQAWSPDGLYLTSGSADPMFHIFDVRYNSRHPSQSVQAHQKRVFKAAWHQSLPLLISISSDLNVGIHKTK